MKKHNPKVYEVEINEVSHYFSNLKKAYECLVYMHKRYEWDKHTYGWVANKIREDKQYECGYGVMKTVIRRHIIN